MTITEVAASAGVSIGTVSKALNGRAGISPQTRSHIAQVAKQMGFRPNPLAQGLIGRRTGTVGLLTNDLEGRFSLPILMGVEDALGAGQLSVFLCDARGDAIREKHHLSALLDRRVDGIIVVADTAAPRASLGRSIPIPVVYAYGPSTDPADMSVVTDNSHAGRIGIEHLISTGRTKVAYAGGDASYEAARDRASGAATALEQAGLSFAAGPVFGPWNEAWGRQAARLLLKSAPDLDAIMCGSDQIARGVLDELRESGHDVPGQVAVLGHDNWEIFATQARPPLSTIDMNFEQLGRTAAQLLFEAIGDNPQAGIHTVLGSVVPRGSTI